MARFDEKSQSSEFARSESLYCHMSIFNFLVNDIIGTNSVNAESIIGIGSEYDQNHYYHMIIRERKNIPISNVASFYN